MSDNDFDFRVGDKVYCLIHGEGIVKSIGNTYMDISFLVMNLSYYLNGKWDKNYKRTLYHRDAVIFYTDGNFSVQADFEVERKTKKFFIHIEELCYQMFEIEAETKVQAFEKAKRMYKNGELVVDNPCLLETNLYTEDYDEENFLESIKHHKIF